MLNKLDVIINENAVDSFNIMLNKTRIETKQKPKKKYTD